MMEKYRFLPYDVYVIMLVPQTIMSFIMKASRLYANTVFYINIFTCWSDSLAML